MNALCFAVHFSMVAVTYHMAYRRHGLWAYETDHMDVRIHRISMIPTPEMIRQNLTQWGSGWNGSLAVTEFYIKDNGLAINYATLVMVFFAISAVFHFWALIMGAFECFWFWYWRHALHSNTPHITQTHLHWRVSGNLTTASRTGAGSSESRSRFAYPSIDSTSTHAMCSCSQVLWVGVGDGHDHRHLDRNPRAEHRTSALHRILLSPVGLLLGKPLWATSLYADFAALFASANLGIERVPLGKEGLQFPALRHGRAAGKFVLALG